MKAHPDWSPCPIEGLGVAKILLDEELEIHISEWEDAYKQFKFPKNEGPLPILYAERERRQMSTRIPRVVTDGMALELWRVGCCTLGLASKLLRESSPEHSKGCPLVEYFSHRFSKDDPLGHVEWLRELDRKRV